MELYRNWTVAVADKGQRNAFCVTPTRRSLKIPDAAFRKMDPVPVSNAEKVFQPTGHPGFRLKPAGYSPELPFLQLPCPKCYVPVCKFAQVNIVLMVPSISKRTVVGLPAPI